MFVRASSICDSSDLHIGVVVRAPLLLRYAGVIWVLFFIEHLYV